MNFVRFIENRFQELRWKQSCDEIADKPFRAGIDSEIKAAHELLQGYRTTLKWLLMPKLLIHFLLVKMKIVREPVPILVNKAREQKTTEEMAKKILEESKNVTAIKPDVISTAKTST